MDRLLRRMRLPYLRRSAPDMLATARAQRWDPAQVLRVFIEIPSTADEVQQRGPKLPNTRIADQPWTHPKITNILASELANKATYPARGGCEPLIKTHS